MAEPAAVDRGSSRSLTHSVVEQIRSSIDAAVDKLPAESALMEQFAVSRTVIREAISRLQAAGLVETYRGKGTYVLTRPSEESFTAGPEQIRTPEDRLQLLDFRLGLEVEASALAALRRTPTQLAKSAARWRTSAPPGTSPARRWRRTFGSTGLSPWPPTTGSMWTCSPRSDLR